MWDTKKDMTIIVLQKMLKLKLVIPGIDIEDIPKLSKKELIKMSIQMSLEFDTFIVEDGKEVLYMQSKDYKERAEKKGN